MTKKRRDPSMVFQTVILFVIILAIKSVWQWIVLPRIVLVPLTPHTGEMVDVARSISLQGVFGNTYTADSGPSAHVAPLYPYYLALIFQCFSAETVPVVVQIGSLAAAALSLALLPMVCRSAGFDTCTWICALALLLLSPFPALMESGGYWEQSHSALGFVLAFLVLARLIHRGADSPTVGMIAGAVIGIVALLNPAILAIAGIAGLADLIFRSSHCWNRVYAWGLAGCVCAVVIAPWIVRNYVVLGGFAPIRSNFGLELFVGNHPGADGQSYSNTTGLLEYDYGQLHPYGNEREVAHLREVGELRYMKEKEEKAWAWIRANPSRFLWLCYMRFRWYWLPIGGTSLARIIWNDVLTIGCLLGLLVLAWRRHELTGLFFAFVIGAFLPYLFTHVEPRYRYPALWVSALLTGFFVIRAGKFILSYLRRGPAGAEPN